MPIVKPVIELVNTPVPAPSDVLLSVIVGFADVLQQTPRLVTAVPPSLVTLPPLVAVVVRMEEITVVFNPGTFVVMKLISLP